MKDLILKNRSPAEYCNKECDNKLLTFQCPFLIEKVNNKKATLPKQFICGKNFLKQYYQRVEKINQTDKSKEVLKLFAKPKLDCLLKEEKFKIQQKKENLYTYISKNAEKIEDVLRKLEKESFCCYDIQEEALNSFVSVNNYKFIDFNSSLLLYLKIYKEYESERIIGFFISKKENEFYKISGGVY